MIECDRIEAPAIKVIASRGVTIIKKAGVQVAVSGECSGLPFIGVDLEGDRITLEGELC